MNELSSIAWPSRALRLIGLVVRRLGAPRRLSGPVADAREVELGWNARSHHQAKPGLALGCGKEATVDFSHDRSSHDK